MSKFNPERCLDCRRGRACPLPKKCPGADDRSWSWTSGTPSNDLLLPATQVAVRIPPLTRSEFKSQSKTNLSVYTSRIDYRGDDGLNVTRKSADGIGLAFAPSWKILRPALDALARAKILSGRGLELEATQLADRAWETYVHEYTHEMRVSYALPGMSVYDPDRSDHAAWVNVLARERVTLLCYCIDPSRCHRTVLGNILAACGATFHGEVRCAA